MQIKRLSTPQLFNWNELKCENQIYSICILNVNKKLLSENRI